MLGSSAVDTLAYDPDRPEVVAGSKDDAAVVIDLSTPARPRLARTLDTTLTSWADTAAFSRDGTHAVIGGADGQIDVYETRTWSRTEAVTHSSQVTAGTFSPDGLTVITAEADGVVRSWPLTPTGIAVGASPIFSLAYDRAGSTLAVSSTGHRGAVTLFSLDRGSGQTSGARVLSAPAAFGHPDGTVAMTPDASLLATANALGSVLLARGGSSGELTPVAPPLAAGSQTIEVVAFSPDGRTLAAGSDDGFVHLWDVSDPGHPQTLPPLDAHGETVSVAFSPNGRYLAATSVDHHVHLWRISGDRAFTALPALAAFANYAWSVSFSPDSTRLAAGGADNTIRLWSLAGPDIHELTTRPMIGPTHYVFGVAFSPDGQTLAAAGGDGTVWTYSLTDPAAPQTLTTLRATGKSAYAVAFSPDGSTLAAAGGSGTVTFWPSTVAAAAQAVCTAGGTQLSAAEWAQYVPGAPYRRTC